MKNKTGFYITHDEAKNMIRKLEKYIHTYSEEEINEMNRRIEEEQEIKKIRSVLDRVSRGQMFN